MDDKLDLGAASMPPLPAPLAVAFHAAAGTGGKRERTQAQLLQAAVKVLAARGVAGATMQEIAQVAGMTAGTLYNHFSTREALLARLAMTLADGLCRAINDSYAHIADGAQRMAIGQRRYVRLAAESPHWTLLLLDVFPAVPEVLEHLQQYPLADLRMGVRQRKFKVPSEEAAMDVINGVCTSAMRRVAAGRAPADHDIASATLVLRALGMAPADAAEVARRPLPPLQMPQAPAPRRAHGRAAV
jgi:AcrR family transcriptional regulator